MFGNLLLFFQARLQLFKHPACLLGSDVHDGERAASAWRLPVTDDEACRRKLTAAMFGGLSFALSSCGSDLYERRDVTSFSDGASLHITNEALIPYAKIRGEMNPRFVLEGTLKDKEGKPIPSPGNVALEKVLPTTSYYEEQIVRALGAALAVNLATTTTKNVTDTKSGGPEGPQVIVSNNTTYTSGTVPTPEQIKAGQTGMPQGAITKIESMKTDDKNRPLNQSDPLLQYNLAAALVQEVALLNHALDYIESADSSSHHTFVMRLRVAVQPTAPNQPYNAVVALGFFCVPLKGGVPDYDAAPLGNIVKVHPLLVMDDLAATSTARSAQLITQLSLAISGMAGSAGFGGIFNSNTSRIRALLGKDLDSTYSISRTSDNTATVRLGAPRQPTASYAMINRNHSVSVVLQVPRDCETVNISAAASLRNAETGAQVPDPPQPVWDSMRGGFRRFLESYVDSSAAVDAAMKNVSTQDLRRLGNTVRPPNEPQFNLELKNLLVRLLDQTPSLKANAPSDFKTTAVASWRSLWVVMNTKLSHSPYQNVSVTVPRINQPSGAGPSATVRPVSRPSPGGPSPGAPAPTAVPRAL